MKNNVHKIPSSSTRGSRINIWKQDPTVTAVGVRTVYLPKDVYRGPSDSQITIKGLPELEPDASGDFLYPVPVQSIVEDIYNPPEVTAEEQRFDAAHTFAIVRKVLTMYERVLGITMKWVWNRDIINTEPLAVYPHSNLGRNAYYDRGLKSLRFEYFYELGKKPVFTCRSLDIVSHETAHALIDSLKPGWNISEPGRGITLELAALQESLCDLTTIFFVLSKYDLVEHIVAQTKANLREKDNILAVWSEQLEIIPGVAGARNAINDLRLSTAGTQIHRISQVLTGAVYDILSDIFDLSREPDIKDDAETLYHVNQYMLSLMIRAIINSPEETASFKGVANEMIRITTEDGHRDYAALMYDNFVQREIITEEEEVKPSRKELAELIFDYRGCWGNWKADMENARSGKP